MALSTPFTFAASLIYRTAIKEHKLNEACELSQKEWDTFHALIETNRNPDRRDEMHRILGNRPEC